MPEKNKTLEKRLTAFGITLFLSALVNFAWAQSAPKIYAVVVGVTRYEHSNVNKIKYADKDAEAFAAFLKSPQCGNTPNDQVALLVNEDATRANVLMNVRRFASLASSRDVLILYFAGHGTNETDEDEDFYMETYNTDSRDVMATGTSAKEIKYFLNQSSAKMIFWIMDACNSGKIGPGRNGRRGNNTEPSRAQKFLAAVAIQKKGGFVYIASSQSQETTIEADSLKHGLFTYYLLEGLQGYADENNDGIVTVNECYDYVHFHVIKASSNYQHPVMDDLYFNGRFPMSCTGNIARLQKQGILFDRAPPTSASGTALPYFNETIKINCLTNTHINVKQGETVLIKAWGTINVGPIVGDSSPDGRSTGLFGFSLVNYDIVKNFKHAVLMFKLADGSDWTACGSNYKFKAEADGELIFQVNDNDQGNNSGAYTVEIQKFR